MLHAHSPGMRGRYSAFFAAFFAALRGAAFFEAAGFASGSLTVFFFFAGLDTPALPMWILPRFDLLSPFPIVIVLGANVKKYADRGSKPGLCGIFAAMQGASNSLGFRKEERLCGRKEIDRLFAEGKAINVYPLRVMFTFRSELPDIPAKTLFVVARRNFRKAHDRNRLRRRMREAFRLHKAGLYTSLKEKDRRLTMAVMYTSREESDFAAIEKAIVRLLEKLAAAV
jgi:ribonuclease P protein component